MLSVKNFATHQVVTKVFLWASASFREVDFDHIGDELQKLETHFREQNNSYYYVIVDHGPWSVFEEMEIYFFAERRGRMRAHNVGILLRCVVDEVVVGGVPVVVVGGYFQIVWWSSV